MTQLETIGEKLLRDISIFKSLNTHKGTLFINDAHDEYVEGGPKM